MQISDHRHCGLLPMRRERPRRRRTAECGQQFPPSDSDCHTPSRARCVEGRIPRHERAVPNSTDAATESASRPTNGDGLYLDGKLCWPIKPLTCLRPDGTEESCDKRQTPLPRPRPADAPQAIPIPKTVLYDEPGGYLHL